MPHLPLNDDLARIERRISKLERRSSWVGATQYAEWAGVPVSLVADPGNTTSALCAVLLQAGRWHVFGSVGASMSSACAVYAALRLSDAPTWESTADEDSDLDSDLENAITFRTVIRDKLHVYATVVLDRALYVQLGATRVSGTATVNVEYAHLFAIPG